MFNSPINKKILKYFLSVILWLSVFKVYAQNSDEIGAWSLVGIKWKTRDKLSLLGDFQLRSSAFYRIFYHIETKFNVLYSLNDWLTLVPGFGRYIDYTKGGDFDKPLTQNETRLWEEVQFKKALSRFIFENRSRLEQRFTIDGYKNRLRSRFTLTIPINNRTLAPNTIFTCLYDDIFYLNKVDINRIYGGLGYKTGFVNLQAGWLYQVKNTSDVKEYLNALFVTMIFEIQNKDI